MSISFSGLIFIATMFLARVAIADPASDMLLISSESSDGPTGLQSGRYQAKEALPDDQPVFKPKSALKDKKKNSGKRPASDSAPVPVAIAPVVEEVEEPVKPAPGVGEQVSDLFKGGADHTGETYREQLHLDDVRRNKVELEINSGMIYDSSIANLAYRTYYSFSPSIKVQAHLWLMPLVGISADYMSTYSETLSSTKANASSVNVQSTWSDLSIDFRKFYGMSRRSNSLNYGILYTQYQLSVPASETTRTGLSSQGFGLYLNARIPTAPSYAWTFGGDFIPTLIHGETQTALNLQSGSSNTASRLGLFLGGELKLSRENQITWNLGVKMEKDNFTGSPNLTDPYTGLTPSGVSITNTWTYFNLGYRWGQ